MQQITVRKRHALPLLAVPCVLATLSGQDANTPAPVPADLRADVYAVYSAILARPGLSHPNTNARFIIRGVTAARSVQDPADCVAVPDAYRARFQEILEDFANRKAQTYRLDPAFTIDKPYELVDASGAQEFVEARHHLAKSPGGRFAGADDLITLGNVYFDRHRTLALVHMSTWCGNLCGRWQWRILERRGADHWEDRPWVRCMTIS